MICSFICNFYKSGHAPQKFIVLRAGGADLGMVSLHAMPSMLPLLVLLLPLLLVVGGMAAHPRLRCIAPVATLAISGIGLVLAIGGLGQGPQSLHLPLGCPAAPIWRWMGCRAFC